jgi:hypothetical protein
MEFVLIIIVAVIVSVISAAAKKKPRSSEQQDVPPKPTMSDIQRAFMMAADTPERRPQPPSAPPPSQAAPYPSPYPPYTPAYGPADDRPAAASVAPAVAESYMEPGEESGIKPMAAESVSPFAGVQLGAYFMDEVEPVKPAPKSPAPQAAARLSLFGDQQDIVKAFIYAEILPRRERRF